MNIPENRKSILEKALELTTKDRRDVYGHPFDDFGKTSIMTFPIRDAIRDKKIDPRLGHALYMVQVKISRLLSQPDHIDSLVDAAGYLNTYDMVLAMMEQEGINPYTGESTR